MDVFIFTTSLIVLCFLSAWLGYHISEEKIKGRICRAIDFLDKTGSNIEVVSKVQAYMYRGAQACLLYFVIRDTDALGWLECLERYDHLADDEAKELEDEKV